MNPITFLKELFGIGRYTEPSSFDDPPMSSQCLFCCHAHKGYGLACDAFPNGIPDDVYAGSMASTTDHCRKLDRRTKSFLSQSPDFRMGKTRLAGRFGSQFLVT